MTAREQLKREVTACAESIEVAAREGYEGIADYFEDVLDADFIVSGRLEYRGAKVLLACGGPTVELNTRSGIIKGYWGSDYAEWHLKSFANDAVDDYFSELWEMAKGF